MNKTFISICKMSQEDLKSYLEIQLQNTHKEITVGDGYIYAQGKFPVLLVAHMDTVHKDLPKFFDYNPKNNSLSSPQGIGGDDRCGIYMILEVIRRYNCSVLFCEDEEIGAVGAGKFVKTDLAKQLEFNYIIEFDRTGCNDAVFYNCDNPDFEEFITKDFYKTSWGSFSDISVVAPALGCAAVNLSCGYYKAHTTNEYVVLSEMENSIYEACKILERTTDEDKFEYIEAVNYFKGRYSDYDWGFDDYGCEELYYMFEFLDADGQTDWYDTYAFNKVEAVGNFCMTHPEISYKDVLDIYVDKAYI